MNEIGNTNTSSPDSRELSAGDPNTPINGKSVLDPRFNALSTLAVIHSNLGLSEDNLEQLANELTAQTEALSKDDKTETGESLLASQAATLDAIFNALVRRAWLNVGTYPKAMEQYFKLALKAQSQCRCTWEAISKIKNPPHATFVKQANYSNGHQQVNNNYSGSPEEGNAHTKHEGEATQEGATHTHEESKNGQNELLEVNSEQRLDVRPKVEAIKTHSRMEAVGEFHRPKDR